MIFESHIEILAEPDKVFAFLVEPELVKRWQLDLPEPPPLPDGGLRVGTRQRAIVQEYGRAMAIETVVAALSPNELLVYEMQSPNADVRTEFRLVRQREVTILHQTVTLRPKRLMRLLLPLVKGVFHKKVQSRLELLKKEIEGRPIAAQIIRS